MYCEVKRSADHGIKGNINYNNIRQQSQDLTFYKDHHPHFYNHTSEKYATNKQLQSKNLKNIYDTLNENYESVYKPSSILTENQQFSSDLKTNIYQQTVVQKRHPLTIENNTIPDKEVEKRENSNSEISLVEHSKGDLFNVTVNFTKHCNNYLAKESKFDKKSLPNESVVYTNNGSSFLNTNISNVESSPARSRYLNRFANRKRILRVRSESRPINFLYDIMYKENCLAHTSDEDSKVANRSNEEDQININSIEKLNKLQNSITPKTQSTSISDKNEINLINTINKDDHNKNQKLLFNLRTQTKKTDKNSCVKSSSLPPYLISNECNNNIISQCEINKNHNKISIFNNEGQYFSTSGQNNYCDVFKVRDDSSTNKFKKKKFNTVDDKITSIKTDENALLNDDKIINDHLNHTINKENQIDQSPVKFNEFATIPNRVISDSDESSVSIDTWTEQTDNINKMNNNPPQLIDCSGSEQVFDTINRKSQQASTSETSIKPYCEDIHSHSHKNFLKSATTSQNIKDIESNINITDMCNNGRLLDVNATRNVNLTNSSGIKNKHIREDSCISQHKLPLKNKITNYKETSCSMCSNISPKKQLIPTFHISMNQNLKNIDTTVSMNLNSNSQQFKSNESLTNNINKKDYSEGKKEQHKKENLDDFVRDKSAKRKSNLNRSQNEEVILNNREASSVSLYGIGSQLNLTSHLKPNIKRIDRRSETLPLNDELYKQILINKNQRLNERKFSDPAIMTQNEKTINLNPENNTSNEISSICPPFISSEKTHTLSGKSDGTLMLTAADPNQVVSILKKKDCCLEHERSSNLLNANHVAMSTNIFNISANMKRFGILKKRTSLDDSGNLSHSHLSDKRNMSSELMRRNSFEEIALQIMQQNQTHGILKQSSYDGSRSDSCTSAIEIHPQSILKKKDISSTMSISQPILFGPNEMGCEKTVNEELVVLEDSYTFTNDEHEIRPILKQESINCDETMRTPKPILKKKISGDLEEQEIRPILKTSRKSSREAFEDCSFVINKKQRSRESSVRPILKTNALLKRRSLSSFESSSKANKAIPFLLNRRTRSLERHVIPFVDLGAALNAITTSSLEVNEDELNANTNNSVSERVKYMESILNKNSNSSFVLPTNVKNNFEISANHNADCEINIQRRCNHRERYRTQPVTFNEKIIFQETSSALSDLKTTSCNSIKLYGEQFHETNIPKSTAVSSESNNVSKDFGSNKNLFSARSCSNKFVFMSKMSQINKDSSEASVATPLSKSDSENEKHEELIEKDAIKKDKISRSNSVRERANMFQKLQEEIILPKTTASQFSPSKIQKPDKVNSSEPGTEILNKTNVDEETDPSSLSLSERLQFFYKLESQNNQYANISTFSRSIEFGETSPAPNTNYCLQSTPKYISKNIVAPIPMDCTPINKNTHFRNKVLKANESFDILSMYKSSEKSMENYSLEKSISTTLSHDVTSTSTYIPFTKRLKLKSSLERTYFSDDRNNNTSQNLTYSPIENDHKHIKNPIDKEKSPFIENNIRLKQDQSKKELKASNRNDNMFVNNEKFSAKIVASPNPTIKHLGYKVDNIENVNMREKINSFNKLNKVYYINASINKNKTYSSQKQKGTTRIDERYAKFFGIRLLNMEQENKSVSGHISQTNENLKHKNLAHHCTFTPPYTSAVDASKSSEFSFQEQGIVKDFKLIESNIHFLDSTSSNFIPNIHDITKSKQLITAMKNEDEKNTFLRLSSTCTKKNSPTSFTTEGIKYNQHMKEIKKFDEIIVSNEEFLLASKDFDSLFFSQVYS